MLEENSDEAENTLLFALSYAKNIGAKNEAGEISIIMGKHYMDEGNENKAAKYLSEGVDIFRNIGIIKDI